MTAARDRVARLTHAEVAAFVRASAGIPGDDRPWPAALDRDEDEALRISAVLAARDVAAALPGDGLAPATLSRSRRLLARHGHVVALRHAFPAAAYGALVAPFAAATGGARRPRTPAGRRPRPASAAPADGASRRRRRGAAWRPAIRARVVACAILGGWTGSSSSGSWGSRSPSGRRCT